MPLPHIAPNCRPNDRVTGQFRLTSQKVAKHGFKMA